MGSRVSRHLEWGESFGLDLSPPESGSTRLDGTRPHEAESDPVALCKGA
jgi:hypothetical protein